MKKIFPISLLLLAILLAACASPATPTLPEPEVDVLVATATATPDPTITLNDGLSRTITLAGPAQRIISLAPSNTEILYALGAGNQVVGRDAASDFPVEALVLPSIGDTFAGLNSEAIVSLQPDLILAAQITPVEYIAELEQLGLTVFWLANPVTLDGLYTNIDIVAQLIGRQDEAAELTVDLQTREAAIQNALADITEIPVVFYEIDGASDPDAPWTSGSGTFIDILMNSAGGENAGSVLTSDFGQISIEELLVQNPDVILLGDAAYGVTVESVGERAGWDQLAAVQNDQVFPFNDSLVSRPGPRLIDALEQLAALLHPELFE